MTGIIEQYYAPLLKKHGFVPEPDNDQYGPLGALLEAISEVGEGSYWTYGQRDLFDIKIHNFSFNKDFMHGLISQGMSQYYPLRFHLR